MHEISEPILKLLKEPNEYDSSIELYCNVISYLQFLESADENDYIIYHCNNTFEYTPQFYSFIKALFDAKLVEDVDKMTEFLKSYNSENAYQKWIREMNVVLSNDDLLSIINLSFIKKAFFTLIRLERILPGSWGIDVETGNWQKLLKQLSRIFTEIYRKEKEIMN